MNISNKTLAILLIAGMVLSVSATMVTLNYTNKIAYTGLATSAEDTGTVNYSISSNVLIEFTTSAIDWGEGYVDGTDTILNCTMDTEGSINKSTSRCMAFTAVSEGLVLENTGNKHASINITTTSLSSFLTQYGSGSDLNYMINDTSKTGSCNETTIFGTYRDVVPAGEIICPDMSPDTSTDVLEIDFEIAIHELEAGDKTLTVTATASEVGV